MNFIGHFGSTKNSTTADVKEMSSAEQKTRTYFHDFEHSFLDAKWSRQKLDRWRMWTI